MSQTDKRQNEQYHGKVIQPMCGKWVIANGIGWQGDGCYTNYKEFATLDEAKAWVDNQKH